MSIFHQRLRELRESKDLSQQALGELIGMSKSSVNMYERGEREPGLETLEAIADIFNVDIDYLLGKSDIPNRALVDCGFIKEYDYIPDIFWKYEKLNEFGRTKADEYISDLFDNPKYRTDAKTIFDDIAEEMEKDKKKIYIATK